MQNALHRTVIVLSFYCLACPAPYAQADVQPKGTASQAPATPKATLSDGCFNALYVDAIGAAGHYYQRIGKAKNFNAIHWEYHLLAGAAPFAFALPEGRIGVNRGLVDLLENADQFVYLMGHQAGHILLQHRAANKGSQPMPANWPFPARAWYAAEDFERIATGKPAPYSRTDEAAADEFALTLMRLAGYDPQQAARFWESICLHISGAGRMPPGKNAKNRIQSLKTGATSVLARFSPLTKDDAEPALPCNTDATSPKEDAISILHVPQTGAFHFVLAAVLPASGITQQKLAFFNAFGPVYEDDTTLDGFSYKRILLGSPTTQAEAEALSAQLQKQGYKDAIPVVYQDGKRVRK